jgi:UPF0755 protein
MCQEKRYCLTGTEKISIMSAMLRISPFTKKLFINLLRICLSVFLAWYLFCLFIPTGSGSVVKDISFPAGTGIKKLASSLKSAGIIRSSWHFMLVSRLRGSSSRLQAGDYRVNNGMNTTAILQKIVNGEVDFRRFALPEGYSIYQAAELLEQKGIFSRDEFLKASRDPQILSRLGIRSESADGYLFPATYNITFGSSAEQLVSQMVSRFEKAYAAIESSASGLTRHETITLASVIEKEAVSPEEKPLISSVFHNRLRIGMPLQSDPTAVYGVRAFAGKVRKADILRPSPYNTYLNKGLPPGPIGNPGADAIKAAINPAKTDFLYFVARQDGTHQFSRSLEEHNRAVRKYLK